MHTVHVDHVVRNAFENRLHHHLEHDPRHRGADASVRPEPERDVATGRPVEYHFVGPVEYPRVVVNFGGSVVEATVSEQSAMIRDPDGQLIELLADGWLAVLPPRP